MSGLASNSAAHASGGARVRAMPKLGAVAIWLSAALIAAFFALLDGNSAFFGGEWLPRGNDSFYHARRILDAAVGARGFYQFDARLHVPDGAWISWPWAYDYLLAKAVQAALWIAPSLDPMAFVSHVPVAWIFVNAALFFALARAVGLSAEMQALAMFCFAISPLTQLLHWLGMIDHHYVELTFVLLCAWLALGWLERRGAARAAALGAALGAATAFHNGLFVLQLFPLVTVFVLWLRGSAPAARELRALAVALVAATLAVLLPSEPFRAGLFEFGLHSWFHLYAAACTAGAFAFMAWRPPSRTRVAQAIAVALLLAIAPIAELAGGAGFLSGSFSVLDRITEVRSPYRMFTETMGPSATAGYYSWLLLVAPLLVALHAYRAVTERTPKRVYFAVFTTLGLALLLMQLRLHYFGYFALVAGTLLLVDERRARHGWHRGLTFVATLGALVLAFQPALRERLFVAYAPASDPEYAAALPLFHELETLCAANPGTVLASPDDGSPILFHTECSVIANNFILRSEDAGHIEEVGRLLRLPPAEIRARRPDVKYLLLRSQDFSVEREGGSRLLEEHPIAKQLFLDAAPPQGFELVSAVRRTLDDDRGLYARLFRIVE